MHAPLPISCDVSQIACRFGHDTLFLLPLQDRSCQNRSTGSKPWVKVSRSDPFNPLQLWGGGRMIQVRGMLGTGGMQERTLSPAIGCRNRTSERAKNIGCAYFARNRPRMSPVGQLGRTDSNLLRDGPSPFSQLHPAGTWILKSSRSRCLSSIGLAYRPTGTTRPSIGIKLNSIHASNSMGRGHVSRVLRLLVALRLGA
jgi:hypothetical protein